MKRFDTGTILYRFYTNAHVETMVMPMVGSWTLKGYALDCYGGAHAFMEASLPVGSSVRDYWPADAYNITQVMHLADKLPLDKERILERFRQAGARRALPRFPQTIHV